MEIIIIRNLPVFFILYFVLKGRNIPVNKHDKKLILLRAIFGTIGMIATYYTYKNMILADALGIAQLTPLFLVALSAKFLGEKIDFRQIIIFFYCLYWHHVNYKARITP